MQSQGPHSLPRLLVDRGGVTMAHVDEALARQTIDGGDFVLNLLESMGPAGEGALRKALAAQTGLELAPEGELPEPPDGLSAKLPADLAVRHRVAPFDERGGALCVAVDEPLPDELLGRFKAAVGAPVVQFVAPSLRVRQALAREYGTPLDRRMARLLARLDGHDDPVPSPPSMRASRPSVPKAAPPLDEGPPSSPSDAPPTSQGLALWLQRAQSAGGRSADRAPELSAAEAETRILESEDTAGALQAFFEFSRQYFTFSALFVVVADRAICFGRYDRHGAQGSPPSMTLFLDGPGCLTNARDRKAPVCARLLKRGLDAELRAGLARPAGALALTLPVLVRGRVAALFYADEGEKTVELSQAGEVIALASLLGNALERFALRRKQRSTSRPGDRPSESEAPPPPDLSRRGQPSSNPPSEGLPSSLLHYQPPTAPPLPRQQEMSLPSIIVSAPSDLPGLLARLSEPGAKIDEVLERVRAEGAAVVPILLSRLPGPTTYGRGDLLTGTVRPRDAGPYFRALTTLGRDALPLVIAKSNTGAPSARFYATYLLGDFPFEEAAMAVAGRLFDPDTDIRTVARVAARHLGPESAVARPLAEALEGTLKDLLAGSQRRRLSAETIGELRLASGLGVLVDALGDGDSSVVDVAHRALVVLTCHDYGHDAAAWRAFARREGSRARAEWLVDSLSHDNATMRLLAAAELAPLLSLPGLTNFALLSASERGELQASCRAALARRSPKGAAASEAPAPEAGPRSTAASSLRPVSPVFAGREGGVG
jgi:type II secretion system (T2SS) protein E